MPWLDIICVNALSGLYLISTKLLSWVLISMITVSMPSRAYTSFLHYIVVHQKSTTMWLCQCPLGLIPHFYENHTGGTISSDGVSMPSRAYTSFLRCNDKLHQRLWYSVNALSGLYLISTVPLQKPRFYAVSRACFCRYLSEYSDNSCFSCMLTFWTYLMRCTYPWHWIKYSTNYNRCHPIFFTLLISWAEQ